MKYGICGGPELLEKAKELGYDYFETPASVLQAMSEEDFAALAARNDAARDEHFEGIRTTNGLFPGTISLVGPAVDETAIRDYLAVLAPRLVRLGVRAVVFGSGGARRCPEGFDRAEAMRQLTRAAQIVTDVMTPCGIEVGMEHLNRGETNTLNTVAETLAFAEQSGRPQLGITLDVYHLWKEGEGVAEVRRAAARIVHCHAAAKGTRGAVTPAEIPELREMREALEAVGRGGRISLECIMTDFDAQGAESLAVLRTM